MSSYLEKLRMGEQIAELEKENAKLKQRLDEVNLDSVLFFNQVCKAKDLIRNLVRVTWGEGWNYSLDWKVKAEEFLKEK